MPSLTASVVQFLLILGVAFVMFKLGRYIKEKRNK